MRISNEVYTKLMNNSIDYKAKQNKYHNKKVVYNGIKFDSNKEMAYYLKLQFLEQANKIKELELQKKFVLQQGYTINGKKRREISYIADFYFYDIEEQRYRVVDVKSPATRTQVYMVKKKLFENKYKIELEEV